MTLMTRYSGKVTSFPPLQRSISIHGHSKDYMAVRVTFSLPLPGVRTVSDWCFRTLTHVKDDRAFKVRPL